MIRLRITHVSDGVETDLAEVRITRIKPTYSEAIHADYSINYAVEKCGAVGIHQRKLSHYSRLRGNVLALALYALLRLTPSELELENAPVDPSNLARRFTGTLPEIQAGPS